MQCLITTSPCSASGPRHCWHSSFSNPKHPRAQAGEDNTLVAYIRRAIPQIRTDRRKVSGGSSGSNAPPLTDAVHQPNMPEVYTSSNSAVASENSTMITIMQTSLHGRALTAGNSYPGLRQAAAVVHRWHHVVPHAARAVWLQSAVTAHRPRPCTPSYAG